MSDDKPTRPRRATRRTTRRVEKAPEPLAEAVPEPWQEAMPEPGPDDWTAEDVEVAAPAVRTAVPGDDAPPVVPDRSIWLPLLEGRSPDATICPFLRAAGPGDAIGFPVEVPDVSNRCAALREPVPQSLRQQELVCLTRAHVDCPRYLRGAVVASEVPKADVHGRAQLTPAVAASLIILGLSFAASVAFGLANGGLLLPSTPPGPTSSAAIVDPSRGANPSLTPAPSIVITPVPTATVAPSDTPEPSAAPTTTPAPTPQPTPTAAPTATDEPTPRPSSDRYDLLKPCPDKPDCYIYRIRSGDNLFSIAKYFGVPLKTVRALNPWTETESLRAGKQLILPPPTR